MKKRKGGRVSKVFQKYALLIVMTIIAIVLLTISLVFSNERVIGGDVDSHGCLIAAGYSWNETNELCVREWEKEFCSVESRTSDACIEIYNPVCGLPIKESFSNSCFACLNRNVKYYIPGECS